MTSSNTYFDNTRSEILSFLPERYSRVLEIGCGCGNFSKLLRNGCEYHGVEPNLASAKTATQILVTVYPGTFEEVYEKLPDSYFDLIICNDVIEHMSSPADFLKRIKKKMARDSCLVGSIPNVRYVRNLYNLLVMKDWRYTDGGGILDSSHLRFFTQKSLLRTFDEAGFSVCALNGINSDFIFPNTLLRILFMLLIGVVIAISFGYYSDIRYLQYGFRIRPR